MSIVKLTMNCVGVYHSAVIKEIPAEVCAANGGKKADFLQAL